MELDKAAMRDSSVTGASEPAAAGDGVIRIGTGEDAPPILSLRDAGKAYATNQIVGRRQKLREIVKAIVRPGAKARLNSDLFWAVDGISLELQRGASVGIIGQNGAGKTTLMKLMAGIVQPDRGEITRCGNTQSMINLSAGINGEFDAVANIRNSCAIRGIARAEVPEKVERILAFAELGKHASAPAQTYSSGMKARLGFAICAHMDPELIIIDEALAVGDATFKNKCLRRLEELRAADVSMVLVSHSMTQIRQFCRDALWIDAGQVRASGPSSDVTAEYMKYIDDVEDARAIESTPAQSGEAVSAAPQAPTPVETQQAETVEKSVARVQRGSSAYGPILVDPDCVEDVAVALYHRGVAVESLPLNAKAQIRYAFRLMQPVTNLNVSLVIFSEGGQMLAAISTLNGDVLAHIHEPGRVEVVVDFADLALGGGRYVVTIAIHDGASYLYRNQAFEFSVRAGTTMTWDLPCSFAHTYDVRADTVTVVAKDEDATAGVISVD